MFCDKVSGLRLPVAGGFAMTFLMIALGLVALMVGGDWLVRGASGIAARLGISPLLIGITLVGFGTSTPELVTSLQAAFIEAPGIAVGNVVGSNIANILLILGVAALLAPIAVSRQEFRRDGTMVVIAALLGLGVILMGRLGPLAGAGLLVVLAAYLVYAVRTSTPDAKTEADAVQVKGTWWTDAAFALAGLVGIILGARWLVNNAIVLAEAAGISEAVIGLTLVAVGTSLPELATSITAALKRQGDIAFGNIVGSNIFNILFILGATALVHPITVPKSIIAVDIWVMLGATAALVVMAVTGSRITRPEGGVLLIAYAAYMGWLFLG